MSANETSCPTPRITIDLAIGPNPPWTNLRFKCANCPAEYQLGAADECEERLSLELQHRLFLTPSCWHCDHVNVVRITR